MALILKCDICERTYDEVTDNLCRKGDIIRHKVKREWILHHERGWEKIDICTDCLKQIRAKSCGKEKISYE